MASHGVEMFPALYETLIWARNLAAPGDVSAALPLDRLAALRGIAPRTLRDHLARLERLGLLQRRYAGQLGISLRVLSQAEAEEGAESGAESISAVSGWRSDDVASAPGVDPGKVALLTAAGVYLPAARALASKPWVTREIIAAWVKELSRVPAVRNLAAVLVYRLQEPSRCLPGPGQGSGHGAVPLHDLGHRDRGHAGEPEAAVCVGRDAMSRDVAAQDGHTAAEHPACEAVGPAAAGVAGATAGERMRVQFSRREEQADSERPMDDCAADALLALWAPIRLAMASRLGPDVDRLWLQRARPQSCSDGVLLLTVPTALGAEWLNLSGAPRCYDAICEVAGRRLLLRFVAAGARDCL